MHIKNTSSCAIQDISGLCTHATPEDAMISFCQQSILQRPKFGRGGGLGRENAVFSFYVFSAAVGTRYKPYGQAFYDFIVKHNLGTVWQSPRRPNKAWHPDHENQVYVWMPDYAVLKAWWSVNDPAKQPVAPVKVRKSRKKAPVAVLAIPEVE